MDGWGTTYAWEKGRGGILRHRVRWRREGGGGQSRSVRFGGREEGNLSFLPFSILAFSILRWYSRIGSCILTCVTVLPVGGPGPVADSLVLVEPESWGAGVLLGHPLHACVEDVAHAGVRVRVEAVQARAQVVGALRGL